MVDLCGLTSTLIIDAEGGYDPHHFNDRLLLGLKGHDERVGAGGDAPELSGGPAREGGTRGTPYHPSYRVAPDPGRLVLAGPRPADPDEHRARVREVRAAGKHPAGRPLVPPGRSGASRRRLRALRRRRGSGSSRSITRCITSSPISSMRAPMRTDGPARRPRSSTASRGGGKGSRLPMTEWAVLTPKHHEGYIGWEQYQANQQRIAENAQMKGLMSRGAPRRGRSRLAGLLRCRRCGRRLHVTYSGANGQVPRYGCRGAAINHGVGFLHLVRRPRRGPGRGGSRFSLSSSRAP